MSELGEELIQFTIAWNGNSYPLELSAKITIGDLKKIVQQKTEVLVIRQKLIGLKGREGKQVTDECCLCDLVIKPNQKVMMMGAKEHHIAPNPSNLDLPEVIDDLSWDFWPSAEELAKNEETSRKLDAFTKKTKITLMNELDPKKKLIVLDLDYTLFDTGGSETAPSYTALKRPFLDEFMKTVYQHYNICVWSQTSWKYIELKLTELGLLTNPDFKISFIMDRNSMFEVTSIRQGKPFVHEVKALGIIWKYYPQFGPHNSIHIDDLSRNFAMNPQNGLKITAYKNYAQSQHDRELFELSKYLKHIFSFDDFTKLDFKNWQNDLRSWNL